MLDQHTLKQPDPWNARSTLVNTHSDYDHIRGNKYYPQSILIISHENCYQELKLPNGQGERSEWLDPASVSFKPAITFKDKLYIDMGNTRLELHYFGVGHTTGDVVVNISDERMAFIGDLTFLNRPQRIWSHLNANSFRCVETMTRLLETLDAEVFVSGHSDLADRVEVQRQIDLIKAKQDRVRKLIDQDLSLAQIQSQFAKNEKALVEIVYNEIVVGSFGGFRLGVV